MKAKLSAAAVVAFVAVIFVLRFCILEGPPLQIFSLTRSANDTLHFATTPSTGSAVQASPNDTSVHFNTHPPHPGNSSLADIFSLFPCCNISSREIEFISVWRQFRPVMARPDLFSDSREDQLEAYSAWKKLVEFLNEAHNQEVAKPVPAPTDEPPQKQCPYSVSYLNTTDLRNNKAFVLKIPCGLVLDSSITLVGVLEGLLGEFKIDLIGGDEEDPPIILHYNVRLRGDSSTNAAVIVQNTWTEQHQWEKESRCPSKDPSGSKMVDGLETCAKSVGKPMAKHQASSSMFGLGRSGQGSKEKQWFPFTNGLPFAATLWLGWEGFHMTVDGKHVTSFEYRQSLEPWMVNGVKLAGDLQLNSIMAKGLPVREDASDLPDLELLKAPGNLSKNTELKIFIGVVSTGNNFDRRLALRRSWMQYEAVRSGTVAVRFFVGLNINEQVNIELWKEAVSYGDIQLLPFIDYYDVITLKSIAICIYATQNLKADFIMKTDDDTFVRVDEVLARVYGSRGTGALLYGYITHNDKPHRDKNNKWYISEEEWSLPMYPPWAHGPGYIISNDIAKFIVKMRSNKALKLFKLEDVAMGIWIEEFRRKGHDVSYVHDMQFDIAGCKTGYVIAHYQTPRNMLCIWEQLQRGLGPVCCP
ncbi:hypothetical protein O6H91_15G082500 [Diphasiastrum complanatum]|uniref:Uncharacterized protein n=3 Tax=Diphasiastrum complanatum TaxID=34168 RepID=A0ACC2BK86_DIPCM|nr:hypothetical protein O6H91_15G082500 [Diphasiastrum complanatum]KAJ7530164.1 hypothetical protein O6H91_15G082500 [Diphasiastrum complanatum]KAJ7530167.1 hypothetical protein O6H91_15G082500 [Diphasiastrum complanatum]